MTAPATQSEGRRRARHGDRRRVCRCCMHRLRGVGVTASVVRVTMLSRSWTPQIRKLFIYNANSGNAPNT